MGALGEVLANVVEAFDAGWERCQLIAPAYDRGYGSSL